MIRWTAIPAFALLFVLGLGFSGCDNKGDQIDTVALPIAPVVNKLNVAEKYYNRKVQLKTETFYRANEYRRFWLGKRKPERVFEVFMQEVENSERYGFHPEEYHIEDLQADVRSLYDDRDRTNADISELDIRISASFFLFTTHLLEGRVRFPGAREFFWEKGMPLENDIALLLKIASPSDFTEQIKGLHPRRKQYWKLQEALTEYRQLEQADTLSPLPATFKVSEGNSHVAVPLLRRKLALTDYNGRSDDTSIVFDKALMEALKQFQERHGLEPDGVPGPETVKLLNMPIKQRSDLIALNLERLRWRPHIKGEGDEIIINVPEYMLRIYRNNKETMKMRVVLGAEFTPTPVFHDTLKYIVFSPTWVVPRSIFEEEFYPKLREDLEHFEPERFRFYKDGKEIDPLEEDWEDKDFDISRYSVTENPGDVNALGKVKFIMPNSFSVYLHDTPADKLFKRDDRALSHGCIRLERPEDFAEYLLSGQEGWDRDKILEAMNGEEPKRVNLERVFPVYIVYQTAWVDNDEKVHFRDDVYGHDRRHLASLALLD